uniref:WW domain-containing protein n=1 Tax=Trichuris muris TaxID=70415 RepID=A0A5S6Q234_TRIMR
MSLGRTCRPSARRVCQCYAEAAVQAASIQLVEPPAGESRSIRALLVDVGATDSGVGKATADGATNESALSIAGTSWNSVSNRENAWSSGSSAPAKASVNEVVYWKTPYEKDQWGGNMGAVRTPSGWEEPPQTVSSSS